MKKELKAEVETVLNNIFPTLNGRIEDWWGPNEIEGWDSMKHLDLVMALGERFQISLEFEEILSIESIEDIYLTLEKRGIR